jgi:hypothetical protein
MTYGSKEMGNFLNHMLAGIGNSNSANKSVVGNYIVSTVKAYDTDRYETALGPTKQDNWVIVEQYDSHDDALEGHEKWEKVIESGQRTFNDVLCDIERDLRE